MLSNLCFDHEFLFDWWLCDGEGAKVYGNKKLSLRAKRIKFRKWMDTLTPADVVEFKNS